MMRLLRVLIFLLVCSCNTKQEQSTTLIQTPEEDTTQASQSFPVEMVATQLGSYKIEEIRHGKLDAGYWENGLTEVKYRIYRKDTLLTELEVLPNEFSELFNKDFYDNSKIWKSSILNIDTTQQRIIIVNTFGLPESDNLTQVVCISDFQGNKSYMDSSPDCSSGINFSYNRIVNCDGVYDYSKPILEYNQCCTVFSDLINNTTLFYVIDRNDKFSEPNAFLLDLVTKDTLESFIFKDFWFELDYSSMIVNRKDFGILIVYNSEKNELTTWNTKRTKRTYNLKKMKQDESNALAAMRIEMYGEIIEKIIIEFDTTMTPIRWNM
jgi:hypothetical protein